MITGYWTGAPARISRTVDATPVPEDEWHDVIGEEEWRVEARGSFPSWPTRKLSSRQVDTASGHPLAQVRRSGNKVCPEGDEDCA